tara:strand:+ start:155 stop:661 length:507 start_codon:yes stop_codon:yes gene_type:complete
MDLIMTKNKNILSTLMIALLLSACGSSSSDKEKSNSVKVDEAIMQETKSNNTQQEVTKLVATPINASDDLKGQTVEDLNNKIKDEFSGWQRGRVQFLNLEGGFYGIITDSGRKILPLNMAKEFAQNGAIVRIKGKVKNVMTIQQWGTPFTITEIELIEPGNKVNHSDM